MCWTSVHFNFEIQTFEKDSENFLVFAACKFNFFFLLLFCPPCPHNVFFHFSHLAIDNVVNIRQQLRQLQDYAQRNADGKLGKQECNRLYPGGNKGRIFFEIQQRVCLFVKAQALLRLCAYDFALARSAAEEAASLFYCDMELLKRLCKSFDKDVNKALEYLRKFKEHQPRNAATTHCKAALTTLTAFKGKGSEASAYLSLFKDNGITAFSFLSNFQNDATKAMDFLEKFDKDGEKANRFLESFESVKEANDVLQMFNENGNEASEHLKNPRINN